jgi:hypothetical protein
LDCAGRGQCNHGFFHNSLEQNSLIDCIALARKHGFATHSSNATESTQVQRHRFRAAGPPRGGQADFAQTASGERDRHTNLPSGDLAPVTQSRATQGVPRKSGARPPDRHWVGSRCRRSAALLGPSRQNTPKPLQRIPVHYNAFGFRCGKALQSPQTHTQTCPTDCPPPIVLKTAILILGPAECVWFPSPFRCEGLRGMDCIAPATNTHTPHSQPLAPRVGGAEGNGLHCACN